MAVGRQFVEAVCERGLVRSEGDGASTLLSSLETEDHCDATSITIHLRNRVAG